MEHSLSKMPRPVRRRLKKVVQKSSDHRYARRAHALLLLYELGRVSAVAKYLHAARSAIYEWVRRYKEFGETGLVPEPPGRKVVTTTDKVGAILLELIDKEPGEYGYMRSRWTTEMLAQQVRKETNKPIHASTVRRYLPRLGVRWNRARPTLHIPDPNKKSRMKAISNALNAASERHPVFYVDEVDIDFNPRIGNCWGKKGEQATIPTPGKNQKRYMAGALNAQTGKVIWVEWEKKNSEIFVLLMAELRKRYRMAKKITLIADNYIIHKSAMTKCFLERNEKFKLLFQPAYHPWVNRIELVWKQLHDNVTRNHKHSTMNKLMEAVRRFMVSVSPFPGGLAATTQV